MEDTTQFSLETLEDLTWAAKKLMEMEAQKESLVTQKNQIISNMDQMIRSAEADIESFKARFEAESKTVIAAYAKEGQKSILTPYGRIGVKAYAGAIDARNNEALQYFKGMYPNAVVKKETEAVSVTLLTADQRAAIYKDKEDGRLPSCVHATKPDPEKLYFQAVSTRGEGDDEPQS